MAVGSKDLTAEKLDELDSERLFEELKKAKEELFNLRFQSATGQLESHGRLRSVKKDIARIYTVLRERELGIRAEPVAVVADTKAAKKSKKDAAAAEAKPAAEVEVEAEAATEEVAK
jgi:large subunit ribosomal protein L29